MDIFEKASRTQLRFEGGKGAWDSEDLWGLDLKSLDTLAKAVNHALKGEEEESFLSTSTRKKSSHNELRLSILKHIISVKEQEQTVSSNRAAKHAQAARIREIMASKADEQLQTKDLAELAKLAAELEADETSPELATV
jgi:hypothetical protein